MREFRAVLERGELGWTVARVPFDPRSTWPKMIRLRIRGQIVGPLGCAEFRSSLFANASGDGGFFLLVNRTMQKVTGAATGTEAQFRLEPDLQQRLAELPEELDALLDEAEGLRAWYGELTEYSRREIGKWIDGVKTPEARLRRAQAMAERLLSTMEAEAELPPMVERAFRAQPKARAGWSRMTAAQRRTELMAIFSYQTPEARERRVAKLCQAAAARSE